MFCMCYSIYAFIYVQTNVHGTNYQMIGNFLVSRCTWMKIWSTHPTFLILLDSNDVISESMKPLLNLTHSHSICVFLLHTRSLLYQEMFELFTWKMVKAPTPKHSDPNSLRIGTATCLTFYIAPVLSAKHPFAEDRKHLQRCVYLIRVRTPPPAQAKDGPALSWVAARR